MWSCNRCSTFRCSCRKWPTQKLVVIYVAFSCNVSEITIDQPCPCVLSTIPFSASFWYKVYVGYIRGQPDWAGSNVPHYQTTTRVCCRFGGTSINNVLPKWMCSKCTYIHIICCAAPRLPVISGTDLFAANIDQTSGFYCGSVSTLGAHALVEWCILRS